MGASLRQFDFCRREHFLTFALNYFILLINILRCQILDLIFALRHRLVQSVFNMCKQSIFILVFEMDQILL